MPQPRVLAPNTPAEELVRLLRIWEGEYHYPGGLLAQAADALELALGCQSAHGFFLEQVRADREPDEWGFCPHGLHIYVDCEKCREVGA